MRIPLVPFALMWVLCLLIDLYIYHAACRCKSRRPRRFQAATATVLLAGAVLVTFLPYRTGGQGLLAAVMWAMFTFMSIYAAKLIFTVFDLLARMPRLWRRPPWRVLTGLGALLGLTLLMSMWWGALIGRYRLQVKEVTVSIPALPAAFDGYRIAQISDLHVGTYGTDTAFVSRLVDRVNALHPDLIVFTGDIVNRQTSELPPFTRPLGRLHAPDGVMSILGNHDYGDYFSWPSPQAKARDRADMIALQRRVMGWDLLLNEHRFLHRGSDSIAVIGVENIGDPPFHIYGSLRRAYPDAADPLVKILLSHTPSHWTDSIARNPHANIALTLSGHTHAMQMELAGVTPASLRYPTWGGLYSEPDSLRQLYVNIGIGAVGIPMRLGATPEITLITLTPR